MKSGARGGAGGEALPLPDRCWDLFCQGHSYAAIGRTLGIDRETAARHVKALYQQVQADRRADRALALSRALATQQRIQATAWTLLAHAQTQATAQETAPAPSSASSVVKPPSSLADCARLLNLILASAREAARLELLYDRDAPARTADQDPKEKTVHLIIERVGDPYVDPTHPDEPVPPPPPGSTPPDTSPPSPSRADPGDDTGNSADHAVPDSTCSPSRAGERSGEKPISPTTPLAHPGLAAPFTARADPPPLSAPAAPLAPEPPSPIRISLSDGSPVRSASSPLPAGEGPGVRFASGPPPRARGGVGGEAPRPRRVRFGLPIANGYPLG